MTVVQINSTCGIGSTGKICVGISRLLTENGVQNNIVFSCETSGYSSGIPCSAYGYRKIQALKSRVFGNYGFNSALATRKMIRELERIRPDVVHLHNIHGHDCDLELLFSFFRDNKTKLVWTFHDCWAFTGYCTHFTMVGCDKWTSHCADCPQRREYTWLFDRSEELFEAKKRLFAGLNMTIVTPSVWMAELVRQSFLKNYPVQVIRNGIDLDVFQPTEGAFRRKHGLEQKKLVLGVSFDWGPKKGLDVFLELAHRLPEDYGIILVGTDEATERMLPDRIVSVCRTQDQRELAEIYTSADVFVNPTREENFPTVNMEALACGTPVITFQTGGSPEALDETCGSVVACGDLNALESEIVRICEQKPFPEALCVARAREFEKGKRFKEYLDLYERIVASGIKGN